MNKPVSLGVDAALCRQLAHWAYELANTPGSGDLANIRSRLRDIAGQLVAAAALHENSLGAVQLTPEEHGSLRRVRAIIGHLHHQQLRRPERLEWGDPLDKCSVVLARIVDDLDPSRRRASAAQSPAQTYTHDQVVAAARNVGVDLTCGECAALFFTGYPSSLSGPPEHASSCQTEQRSDRGLAVSRGNLAVSCTCGTSLVEASAAPPVCPRCQAPERAPARATDYVAPPWEELDARRRMYGVFHGEGESPDPIAIVRSEESAARWLAWQETLGDDADAGRGGDYTIAPIDQLDGGVWNSFEPPPADPASR